MADDTAPTPQSGETPQPGLPRRALVDRYVVEERLGEGGMGIVYAARDPDIGRTVAIKLVRPHRSDADARARLVREAQAMAKVSHPGVVSADALYGSRAGVEPHMLTWPAKIRLVCHRKARRFAEALAGAERALTALRAHPSDAHTVAWFEFEHARTRWSLMRGRDQALLDARRARNAFQAAGAAPDELADMEEFLRRAEGH